MSINLENGKKIILNAANNSETNTYIKSMLFNGKIYSNTWLDHGALIKGAVIDFTMIAKPDKQRGVTAASVPFSLSYEK